MASAPTTSARRRRGLAVALPAATLVLTALCLRGPFAAVGPLLGELSTELGVGLSALAVLAALPLICFGVLSPLAPVLAARIGLHRAVVAGLLLLTVGIAVRAAGVVGLFAGTVLLSAGITAANVLLPALARAEYGSRAAAVIGLVTASMAVSAALGAGLAQPVAAAAGSASAGLALWLMPALLAAGAVALLARARRRSPAAATAGRVERRGILRDRVAVAVTVFIGLQSLSFYGMLTWLPDVLEAEAGVSAVSAGGLTALAALLGAPASLVVPSLATRRPGQVPWVLLLATPTAVAILGLVLAPAAAPLLWALLYGLGTGATFPLAMTLVLVRTRDVEQTGRLSAASQSAGYLLAAVGPIAVGVLAEVTGGWTAGLLLLLGVLAAQVVAGIAAGRARLVGPSS